MKFNLKYGLVALAGLGLSANVAAVDFGCSDITFSAEAFEAYEFVDQACNDIVERGGAVYAKLTAKIGAQRQGGTHYRFYHADGEMGPDRKAAMHAAFLTGEEGEMGKLSDYPTGADVNVYVPQAFWSLPVVEEVAEVQEMAEEAPPPPPPPAPEPEPEMLPATASALPWLALIGSLFLVLGGALRFSRR